MTERTVRAVMVVVVLSSFQRRVDGVRCGRSMDAPSVAYEQLILEDISRASHSVADDWLAHHRRSAALQAFFLIDRLGDRQEHLINASEIDQVNT